VAWNGGSSFPVGRPVSTDEPDETEQAIVLLGHERSERSPTPDTRCSICSIDRDGLGPLWVAHRT